MLDQLQCLPQAISNVRVVVFWASAALLVAAALAICAAPFFAGGASVGTKSGYRGRTITDSICTAIPMAVIALLLLAALQPASEMIRAPIAMFVQPTAEFRHLPSTPTARGANNARAGIPAPDCAPPRTLDNN